MAAGPGEARRRGAAGRMELGLREARRRAVVGGSRRLEGRRRVVDRRGERRTVAVGHREAVVRMGVADRMEAVGHMEAADHMGAVLVGELRIGLEADLRRAVGKPCLLLYLQG